jgi:hypothetical protein
LENVANHLKCSFKKEIKLLKKAFKDELDKWKLSAEKNVVYSRDEAFGNKLQNQSNHRQFPSWSNDYANYSESLSFPY